MGLAPLLPSLMAPSIVREVIPLLLGLVLVARTGTAVTAEIGTLRVTHELDAMECSGINVDAFVVLPRVLGLTIAGATLMVLTGLAGLVGGAAIASLSPTVARVVTVTTMLEALEGSVLGESRCRWAQEWPLTLCRWIVAGIADDDAGASSCW